MKKKEYIKPQMTVYEIASSQLLAASGSARESIGFGSGDDYEQDEDGTIWGQ
ncbi:MULTISPECIES: hypothetical protein [unclassified Prevotella]|uniref:hypothetical protein n=1 Tax=unclassified Prevotella TaxID=2638335 RepID=UPI001303A74B|nr:MULTISPECIES: hypothetical protein [unclassified Prevotella]